MPSQANGQTENPPAAERDPSPEGQTVTTGSTESSPAGQPASTLFENALLRGFAAAESADRARAEIQAVLDVLAQAIGEAAKTRIEATIIAPPAATEVGLSPAESLRLEKDGKHLFLSTFVRSPLGYPVDIEYADVMASCHDKQSLVAALAAMLEHPDVARKVQALVSA